MIDRQKEAYREEAAELLAELEVSLLELEQRPDDTELIGRVFRVLHTIKGSGAMFGFDDIASFTHDLETAFDEVREGRVAATPELVGITLSARDHIQALLRASAGGEAVEPEAGQRILERLRRVIPVPEPSTEPAAAAGPEPVEGKPEQPTSYRVRFEPEADILLTGTNPILLLKEMESMGDYSVIAHLERIPELEEFDCERCYAYWDVVLTTAMGENSLRDVFIFARSSTKMKTSRRAFSPIAVVNTTSQ